jgi:peroxiredoxin
LGGFAENKKQLDEAGVMVVAASIDNIDNAKEVANDLNFPVGYGVTREIADQLGSWWEERRQIIQPSEFIIGQDNNVIASSYSDGPLGRMDATDVIKLANFYTSRE